MAQAPAVQAAIEAVIAKLEAIVPTIDAGQRFRRKDETNTPASSRAPARLFDFGFLAHLRDNSNEGVAGAPQNVGIAERVAQVQFEIEYPAARADLEMTLAVDSELVLRGIARSANWAGTPVRRVVARTAVDRSDAEVVEGESVMPGVLVLVVTADITYRDQE